MRLLHSVLSTPSQTKKPQRKFIAHLLRLLLMLPGHATFRNMSRYSALHEKTFSRWYDRPFDWVSLNKAAIIQGVPPEHEQALAIDASFIPTSGQQTYGLDRFWNGGHSRAEKGLELSTVAWLDITGHCAYALSVEQTPPSEEHSGPDATRIDAYLEQFPRLVTTHDLCSLRYLIADGGDSHQKFVTGVCALGWHQIGKLRAEANLRYLSHGPKRPGRGRQKTYDGKVNGSDLSRFERLETEDEYPLLYHQGLNHVKFQMNLKVVVAMPTRANRSVVLFRTDVTLDALTLYRSYKARFQIEFLFRDSKQYTGLTACQARSKAQRHFHLHASFTAASFAKLEGRQQDPDGNHAFSMASLQRRAFNQHLLDRICEHLAHGLSLEKSSPDYEALCNYGVITEEAA
jgi:Transposase DDE domain